MRRLWHTTFALIILTALGGCASYELGTQGELPYSSINVRPVRNDSSFPLLKASLGAFVKKEINATGMLKTADSRTAERFLYIHVTGVDREIAAVQSQDVGRGRKFQLTFDVNCSLYKDIAGKEAVFVNRKIKVTQDIFSDSGQVNAEYQAGPEITRKIARRVAELLVDTW